MLVSIHAPTRGATGSVFHPKHGRRCFNPRAHEGRDSSGVQYACLLAVSIHAPTRGATDATTNTRKQFIVSIHAPTRGATPAGVLGADDGLRFNPRAHEGRDP